MAEISEDTRHKLTEIAMALLMGLVFFLFSHTPPYERLELLSLDARFNLRPPIQTNPDIATIDIDNSIGSNFFNLLSNYTSESLFRIRYVFKLVNIEPFFLTN